MSENDNKLHALRLEALKKAIGNDKLEGELCPYCSRHLEELQADLDNLQTPYPLSIYGDKKAKINKALSAIEELKRRCSLKKITKNENLLNRFQCGHCSRIYLGEYELIPNTPQPEVLAILGYDDQRVYPKDLHNHPVVAPDYGSLVERIWNDSEQPVLTPRSVNDSIEDIITGEVLSPLKTFFLKFTKEVYKNIGTTVKAFTQSHAGVIEAGKKNRVQASGADFAIWVGSLTNDQMLLLDRFEKRQISLEELPDLVGNGVLIQAKKEKKGSIEKKQLTDLVQYGSIPIDDGALLGIPGKLFMKYSDKEPFVSLINYDFTYALYNSSLLEGKKTVLFSKALKNLPEYSTSISMLEFVQSYLSGRIGTPVLMLKDIMGVPVPKLVVSLPPGPEPPAGLSGNIAGRANLISRGFRKALGKIEEQEAAYWRRIQQQQLRCRNHKS